MHRNVRPSRSHSRADVHHVVEAFTHVGDSRTMQRLFGEIFTAGELADIALRWNLMRLLHQGISQRGVAAELGVSLCKITRGARILKRRGSVCAELLTRRS